MTTPELPIKLKGVASSNIESIGYDPAGKHLYIKFRKADKVYQYAEVSKELWEEFEVAESHGKFLHTRIRPHFKHIVLEESAEEDPPETPETPEEAPAEEATEEDPPKDRTLDPLEEG